MQVRCVRSFAGKDAQGNQVSHGEGDVFDLPEGVDWLQAGLVEIVEIHFSQETVGKAEKAVLKPAEKRVSRAKKG